MWSPKRNANGARNQFYENMRQVSPGDVVFSFCDTRIKAIGVVTGRAQTGPKPDFGAAGANWSREGWFVPVDYCTLSHQVRPKDHTGILRPFLPPKYSPLQESGGGIQSVHLTELPQALADALIGLIGQAYWDAYAMIAAQSAAEPLDSETEIADSKTIGATFKEQIVRARRGQGVFRANVLLREEYLSRNPHIDHLFDQGYITFSSSQELVIVPEVRDKLLDAWGIDEGVRVGEFSREQNSYLDYHRKNVFRHSLLAR